MCRYLFFCVGHCPSVYSHHHVLFRICFVNVCSLALQYTPCILPSHQSVIRSTEFFLPQLSQIYHQSCIDRTTINWVFSVIKWHVKAWFSLVRVIDLNWQQSPAPSIQIGVATVKSEKEPKIWPQHEEINSAEAELMYLPPLYSLPYNDSRSSGRAQQFVL